MPAAGMSRVFNLVGGADIQGAAANWKRLGHLEKGLVHFKHTSCQANDDRALKFVIDRQV